MRKLRIIFTSNARFFLSIILYLVNRTEFRIEVVKIAQKKHTEMRDFAHNDIFDIIPAILISTVWDSYKIKVLMKALTRRNTSIRRF